MGMHGVTFSHRKPTEKEKKSERTVQMANIHNLGLVVITPWCRGKQGKVQGHMLSYTQREKKGQLTQQIFDSEGCCCNQQGTKIVPFLQFSFARWFAAPVLGLFEAALPDVQQSLTECISQNPSVSLPICVVHYYSRLLYLLHSTPVLHISWSKISIDCVCCKYVGFL